MMYSMVMVDNEYIVPEGLSKVIDWASMGVQIAGEVSDGNMALELIREKQPDFVIMDIRMTGITGLQLIEACAEEQPDLIFILFNRDNEYEYVRRAYSLGVVDYIDKPITVESVFFSIRRVTKILDKRRELQQLQRRDSLWRKQALEGSLYSVLKGGLCLDRALVEDYNSFVPGFCEMQNHLVAAFNIPENNRAALDIFEQEIGRLRTVSARHGLSLLSMGSLSEQFIILFDTGKTSGVQKMMSALLCTKIDLDRAGLTFYVGISDAGQGIVSLGAAFTQAQSTLRHVMFKQKNNCMRFEEIHSKRRDDGAFHKEKKATLDQLRLGNKHNTLVHLTAYIQGMSEAELSPSDMVRNCLYLLFMSESILLEMDLPGSEDQAVFEKTYQAVVQASTLNILRKTMFDFFESTTEIILTKGKADIQSILQYLKKYITNYYFEDISLDGLAELAGLNRSYLSHIFKEYFGISYIKYLTHVRIEKAKEFLVEGYKVKDVCNKVGYANYRHFCYIFRENTGMTPDGYRFQLRETAGSKQGVAFGKTI